MNKLIFGTVSIATVLICGCVSQSDYEALSADCKDINDRLTKIESDLYKIEIKQAPRSSQKTEEKKFEPNKDVAVAVIDAKTAAFIKEYIGVAFGDDISLVKDDDDRNGKDCRYIKMIKPFKYFDRAWLRYTDGKLTFVEISAFIEKRFARESVEKRFQETRDDLALILGYQKDFNLPAKNMLSRRRSRDDYPTISIGRDWDTRERYYELQINFSNNRLEESLIKKRNQTGEELPEAK